MQPDQRHSTTDVDLGALVTAHVHRRRVATARTDDGVHAAVGGDLAVRGDPVRLGLVVTNVLYFRSLRRIGASRATLYMYLQPFLGALFAAILIGEHVTVVQVLGGVVIVGGVSLGRLMPGATVRE